MDSYLASKMRTCEELLTLERFDRTVLTSSNPESRTGKRPRKTCGLLVRVCLMLKPSNPEF